MSASVAEGTWQNRGVRVVPLAVVLGAVALAASSCGGSHQAAPPPLPRWAKQANALCKVDDRAFKGAAFDSAAEIAGLQREAVGLSRLAFFKHLPRAEVDVLTAGQLLTTANADDFATQRRADKLLIRARQAAAGAGAGVHCSFGAFPLNSL
jgi:hypothetical protein